MSVLHPSSIRPFLIFRPHHHVFPNVSFSKHKTALLPNDGVLPTAGTFTECFEENFLPNGVSLPNLAHKSVSFLYQFLVLTGCKKTTCQNEKNKGQNRVRKEKKRHRRMNRRYPNSKRWCNRRMSWYTGETLGTVG
jgi:hypothetical protein